MKWFCIWLCIYLVLVWLRYHTSDKSIITAKSMMSTDTSLATGIIYFKQIEKYLFKEFTYSSENGLLLRFTIAGKTNGFGFGSGFGSGFGFGLA